MSKMMNAQNVPHAGRDPQEHAYQLSAQKVLTQMNSQPEGLNASDAEKRLHIYGSNALPEKKASQHGCVSSRTLTMF